MSVGFTGSRSGMTPSQAETLKAYLVMFRSQYGPEFRHGKAIGADLQAAIMAVESEYDEKEFPAGDDPLARNKVIVYGSSIMLATPSQHHEILRSGTWATIRYANAAGVPGITIWPDGNSTPMTMTRHTQDRHNPGRV